MLGRTLPPQVKLRHTRDRGPRVLAHSLPKRLQLERCASHRRAAILESSRELINTCTECANDLISLISRVLIIGSLRAVDEGFHRCERLVRPARAVLDELLTGGEHSVILLGRTSSSSRDLLLRSSH